jgi:phospholipid transport system substrate-binding protein
MSVSDFSACLRARGGSVLIAIILAWALLITPERAAAEDAVEFMKHASRDLIAAARSGSPKAFEDAINRYGHVPAIGLYALGSYKPQLQASERSIYYAGMVRWIAKYAAGESRKYEVSHAEILGPPQRTERGVFVDSRVHLKDGSTYDVQWMLIPQGNTFRIRDAQVMTFWMTPFLKDLFEKYIAENGGRVQALMIALNR